MKSHKPPAGGPLRGLEIQAWVQDNALHLTYQVKNGRPGPVYLFNVLWDWDATGKYLPASLPVYSCLQPGGQLHLAKMVPPLPRTRAVEVRRVPFVTRVESGETFAETVRLPVPVPEYNPYFPVTPETQYQARPAEAVTFSLQLLGTSEGLKVTPAPLAGALHVQHPALLQSIETLRAGPQRLTVNVHKRLDPFEDF